MLKSLSVTDDNSAVVSIPIGSLAGTLLQDKNIISSNFDRPPGGPVNFDLVRDQETTTTNTTYRIMKDTSLSSGNVLDYCIKDSDPNKYLCGNVYYDTAFHSLAFRDCSTPQAQEAFDKVRSRNALLVHPLAAWVHEQIESSGTYIFAGSLGNVGPKPKRAQIRALDAEGRATRTILVQVMPNTGNVLIGDLKPGKYELIFEGLTRPLTVGKTGNVTLGNR
jgi:hypothetical protein